MRYYVEVYRGNFIPTRVFVSECFDTREEAEKYARDIRDDADWNEGGKLGVYVCQEKPTAYSRCYENADEMCVDDEF